jgi:signal transduction histidine kinase
MLVLGDYNTTLNAKVSHRKVLRYMAEKHENVEMIGLQFFGQISTSISHEIKNVLAIINENAGLLEDLTFMADRGHPLDPARLKIMAATVKKQIGRADAIIRNMNRFAHSVDQPVTTVNLNELVELTVTLTARFATMKNVQLDLQLPQDPLKIQTAPFLLMNLMWLCLDFCMSVCGGEKRVELVADNENDDVSLHFKRLTGLKEASPEYFPSDCEKHLLEMLAADLFLENKNEKIVLRLPRNLV